MAMPSSAEPGLDPVVEFNESDHSYWLVEDHGKRRLMSITQALQIAGLVDTTFFNERAATRGTYVHEATALYDQGRLDEGTVSDELRPYLEGYKLFLEECAPEWSRVEARFADDISDVAGTVDRVGVIQVAGVPQKAVVDIKTGRGGAAPWHPIQLAGYQHLLTQYLSRRGPVREAAQIKRYGLYLRGDSKYTLTPYTNDQDAGPKKGRHGWQ